MKSNIEATISLFDLPDELLDYILGCIPDRETLISLTHASQRFHALTIPYLQRLVLPSTKIRNAFFEAVEAYLTMSQVGALRAVNSWRPPLTVPSTRQAGALLRLCKYITEATIVVLNADEIVSMYFLALFENVKKLRLIRVDGLLPDGVMDSIMRLKYLQGLYLIGSPRWPRRGDSAITMHIMMTQSAGLDMDMESKPDRPLRGVLATDTQSNETVYDEIRSDSVYRHDRFLSCIQPLVWASLKRRVAEHVRVVVQAVDDPEIHAVQEWDDWDRSIVRLRRSEPRTLAKLPDAVARSYPPGTLADNIRYLNLSIYNQSGLDLLSRCTGVTTLTVYLWPSEPELTGNALRRIAALRELTSLTVKSDTQSSPVPILTRPRLETLFRGVTGLRDIEFAINSREWLTDTAGAFRYSSLQTATLLPAGLQDLSDSNAKHIVKATLRAYCSDTDADGWDRLCQLKRIVVGWKHWVVSTSGPPSVPSWVGSYNRPSVLELNGGRQAWFQDIKTHGSDSRLEAYTWFDKAGKALQRMDEASNQSP